MTDAIQKAREALEAAKSFVEQHYEPALDAEYETLRKIGAALAALDAETETLSRKCATEGCGNQATIHFIRGDVCSHYCLNCYTKVQALVTPEARS